MKNKNPLFSIVKQMAKIKCTFFANHGVIS